MKYNYKLHANHPVLKSITKPFSSEKEMELFQEELEQLGYDVSTEEVDHKMERMLSL